MKEVLKLTGIDCAACAAKAERKIQKVKGVTSAAYSFMTQKLTIDYAGEREEILSEVLAACKKIDKSAEIRPY
jgi:copper chaperone CopZ